MAEEEALLGSDAEMMGAEGSSDFDSEDHDGHESGGCSGWWVLLGCWVVPAAAGRFWLVGCCARVGWVLGCWVVWGGRGAAPPCAPAYSRLASLLTLACVPAQAAACLAAARTRRARTWTAAATRTAGRTRCGAGLVNGVASALLHFIPLTSTTLPSPTKLTPPHPLDVQAPLVVEIGSSDDDEGPSDSDSDLGSDDESGGCWGRCPGR